MVTFPMTLLDPGFQGRGIFEVVYVMKIFQTSSVDVVQECQTMFNFCRVSAADS